MPGLQNSLEKAPEPDNKTSEKSTKSQNSDQVSQITILEATQLIIKLFVLYFTAE